MGANARGLLSIVMASWLVGCSSSPSGTTDAATGPVTDGGPAVDGRSAVETTAQVSASAGGTVRAQGATLAIPPNALSGDAVVTLADHGTPAKHPEDPLRPLGSAFSVTLKAVGGGDAPRFLAPAVLTLSLATQPADVQEVILAESDEHPAVTYLHKGRAGKADGPEIFISYDYTVPGTRYWLLGSLAPRPKPTEDEFVQVPWYWQGGHPWCVPTALSALLRFYDFAEELEPLNTTFGNTTALANWQIAGKTGQAGESGAGSDELDWVGAKGHWLQKVWDLDMVLEGPEPKTNRFPAFLSYVRNINAGDAAAGVPRKPLGLFRDFAGHAMVAVGSDEFGMFVHDSNGYVAHKFDWLEVHKNWRGTEESGTPPKPSYKTKLATVLITDLPIKAKERRSGSVVIGPGDLRYGTGGGPGGATASLAWDGRKPHVKGYYFKSDLGGGEEKALRPLPFLYKYRIANVTNVELSYKTVAELSGETYGAGSVEKIHTITVPAHSLSSYVSGQFDQSPSTGKSAHFAVKLYQVEDRNAVQDVKWVTYEIAEPLAPQVNILTPVNGTSFYTSSAVALSGSSYDPTTGKPIPEGKLRWLIDGTQMATGSSGSVSFDTTGKHTIDFVGTGLGGQEAKASISILVEKQLPTTPASVTILGPSGGSVYDTGSYQASTAPVTFLASGSPNMQFSWSSSVQGALGFGASLTAAVQTTKTGNCAPWTEHTITLSGKDDFARTATASIKIWVHTLCIK